MQTFHEHRELARGLRFPEGPIALQDGSVLVVEIERRTLSEVSPDGLIKIVAECGGGPNGAAVGPDGLIYVCNNGGFSWRDENKFLTVAGLAADNRGGSIQRVDRKSGRVERLYDSCDGIPLRGPNDLVFDAEGGFYFTDYGHVRGRSMDLGAVFYAKSDGSLIQEIVSRLFTPNGIGLSRGGDRLYVAETLTGKLWAWEIESPGILRPGRSAIGSAGGELLCGVPGSRLFDSLAVDSAGNVCVGSLVDAGITVVAPTGEILDFIALPGDPLITNICFGGEDLCTAYVTASSSGRLLTLRWPRPGLALAF